MELSLETDHIDVYDTTSDTWRHLSRHPGGPRLGVAAAILGDKLYVCGGYSESGKGMGEIMDDAYSLDLLTSQWSILNYLPKPLSHASLVVLNHQWLFFFILLFLIVFFNFFFFCFCFMVVRGFKTLQRYGQYNNIRICIVFSCIFFVEYFFSLFFLFYFFHF